MSAPPQQHDPGPALGRLRFRPAAPAAPWWDSVLLGVAAFVFYALLRQRALHGLDVPDFINWLQIGKASHHIHYLYMPLVHALHGVVHRCGGTPHQTLLLASALGGALAVAGLHRAGVSLGLGRGDAAIAAALAATPPAVVFFATVAEIHAVFLAFFALACWQWARLLARPSALRALAVGACTAIAAAVHATGHLAVLLLAALTVGLLGRRSLTLRRAGLCALAAHLAGSVCLDAWLRRSAVDLQQEGIVGFVLQCIAQLPLGWNIAIDLWREWLWPFAPLSVVPLLGLLVRSTRRFALAWSAAALAYFAMTVVLLFGKLNERGAYHLPLAWPAALLLLGLAPRTVQVAALGAAASMAVFAVAEHDRPHENPRLIAGVAAAARRDRLFVLCEDLSEYEPLVRDLPSVPSCPLFWLGQLVTRGYAQFTADFDALIDAQIDAGHTVILTERAYHLLRTLPEPTIARFMREHLPARYEVTPYLAPEGGFTAVRLRRR